ncbi:hypothetical protein [Streptomyces sp. NPDC127119]|uniref:hypothetical protein n=1 Tax=Streptomyces sp. NPDC127119 TaxID=3345370 RepID=UPI00362E6D60
MSTAHSARRTLAGIAPKISPPSGKETNLLTCVATIPVSRSTRRRFHVMRTSASPAG